jgi:hypothetical protein
VKVLPPWAAAGAPRGLGPVRLLTEAAQSLRVSAQQKDGASAMSFRLRVLTGCKLGYVRLALTAVHAGSAAPYPPVCGICGPAN